MKASVSNPVGISMESGIQRALIALALISTAALKVFDNPAAGTQLQALHISATLLTFVAIVETLISVLLATRRWPVGIVAAFLFSFLGAGYLVGLRLANLDIETCGCFGSRHVGVLGHLGLLLGTMLLCLSVRSQRAPRFAQPELPTSGGGTAR